ncbi:MAG: hypothetical protein P9M07_02135 [Candidatus Aceula meridiana]|nr:hypothetical protein [Candidatus Aceula meridiana]
MRRIRKIRTLGIDEKAQAAIELALLGSILLFVFGMLIRYGMNFAETQNMQYKAFRQALKLSGEDAIEGKYSLSGDDLPQTDAWHPKGNRKNASLIFIEDRPTVQGGEKYGASSRSPYMAYGSGVFSSLQQLPLEFNETENIPVMDMSVNGQPFVFRTAKFVRYLTVPCFTEQANYACGDFSYTPNCWSRTIGDVDYPNVGPQYLDRDVDGHGIAFPHPWNYTFYSWMGAIADENAYPAGCRDVRFVYTKIPFNHEKFCNLGAFGHHCMGINSTELNWRFDLKREGTPASPSPIDQADWIKMSWQWFPVALTSKGVDLYDSSWTSLDVDGDLKEETVMSFVTRHFNNPEKDSVYYSPTGTSYELDNGSNMPDPTEEDHGYGSSDEPYTRKPIVLLSVIDFQEGDFDATYNEVDKAIFQTKKPGLLEESQITSFVPRDEGGSTFLIDQSMSGQTRTQTATQSGTSYDIVERQFRLSNNTGCFCPARMDDDDPYGNNGWENCQDSAGGPWTYLAPPWGVETPTPNGKPSYCEADNLSVKYACEGEGCCSQCCATGDEPCCNEEGNFCCDEDDVYIKNRPSVSCFEYKKVMELDEVSTGVNLPYNDHNMLYIRTTIASKTGYKTITTENVETIQY